MAKIPTSEFILICILPGFISVVLCNIWGVIIGREISIVEGLIIFMPLYLYGIYYISKRLKEIKRLEDLEKTTTESKQ